jgi:Zn-dependent protease with chaperone function
MGRCVVVAVLVLAAASAGAEPVAVPEPSELALRWYRSGIALWAGGTLLSLAIPFAIFASGLSARLRDLATAGGRRGLFAASAIYAACFVALVSLLELPWSWYVGFVRPHAYGVSSQSLAKWSTDLAIETVLLAGIAALLLWLPLALVRRFPRRWWLACAGLSLPLAAFFLLVHPVWVAPLFNRFGSMQDHSLEARILALAEDAGIEGSRVFEVNKSVDTPMMNAYVTGIGGTKRIVLWDTLTSKLSPAEALAVMGHEMGHYVLHHVLLAIALTPLFVGAALYVVQRAVPPLLRRFAARTGVRDLGDLAAVPLAIALLQLAAFALNPAACAVSRGVEHEADRFALELTRDNEAMARAFVALQASNLGHPRPARWLVWARYTHPPLGDRIDFANAYRPWETGEPLRYADRFTPRDAPRSTP